MDVFSFGLRVNKIVEKEIAPLMDFSIIQSREGVNIALINLCSN
jgi:hypothetical protein